MKNWKTTLAGILAGIPLAISALMTAYTAGTFTDKSGTQLAVAVAIVLLGLFSKDNSVSGKGL